MPHYTGFEQMALDHMQDMRDEARREWRVRGPRTSRVSFDLRCWGASRIVYLSELARHGASRIRGTLSAGQPRPILSDCR